MMQQKSSHPPIAPACNSNGGFDSNVSLTSSINSCFPHSSSSAASGINPWGTWEDLLLASAVLRHGMDNWTTVSCELQARAFLVPPSSFSAEACKVRFWILNGRFSSCNSGTIRDGKIPWFEEVRKLRVAQLKRELEHYDGSIGLLEKKLSQLRAEYAGSAAVVSRDAHEKNNPSSLAPQEAVVSRDAHEQNNPSPLSPQEAVVTRDAHEQNNPSSLAPQEAVTCFQVRSASDRMPAEQSLGSFSRNLLDSELGNSSCATGSVVITGGGEVQETIFVSGLKESLTINNYDQNSSSAGLVFDSGGILYQSRTNADHDMHSGSILDQTPLVCLHLNKVKECSPIEVDHKSRNFQDCPCSIVEDERYSVKIEEAEHVSSDVEGAMSLDMENQSFESEAMVIGPQDDHASILVKEREVCESGIKEVEDGGLSVEDTQCLYCPPGLDRLVHNEVTCTGEGLGGGVKFSRGPRGLDHLVDDTGGANSESVHSLPSPATKHAHNAVKEDYSVGDSVISTSAMDLLRIAYADGTPVSTPEETEIQPVEPEKIEESECSAKSDCLCPPVIQEFAACEPDLLSCNVVESPVQGVLRELQRTKQNQTLGTKMILDKVQKGLEKEIPQQVEPFFSERDLLRGGGVEPIVVVKKESFSSTMHCENGAVELAQAVSHGCDLNLGSIPTSGQILNLSGYSDCENSVMEPVFESLNEQEEPKPDDAISLCAGKGTLKVNSPTVERIFTEVKPDSKASNKQSKLEERPKHQASRKSSRDVVSSSLFFKGKHKADIDALEEDGLLVDLMKLKETDLTTLRKRKHFSWSGNNVEKREDCGLLKDGLGEFVVNKHPKLSRCQEEDGNKSILPATQNKNPSKIKNSMSNSGDNSGQAAMSSTVSMLDSCMDFRSKESAVEVFSTRRSRLRHRKLELQREEPDKTEKGNLGSVENFETALLKAADEASREIGVSPMVDTVETSADNNGLLPDVLILLECLRTISGHRFAALFKVRPEIQRDARYRCLVKRHMDLNTIRTKLEEGIYSESLEFFRDMMLIFSNALVFYSKDSQEYGAARVLRESLMREMDIFFRDEPPPRVIAAAQASKYSSESNVLKNMNIGCSVPTCDVKKQEFVKSSCDPTVCEIGLHSDHGTGEAILGTTIAAQDFGFGNSTSVKELDCKKKERGDLLSSKASNKSKTGRTRARGVEGDRLNLDLERSDRERPSRSLEDAIPNSSTSVISSQVLRKFNQASSRNSREFTARKDPYDRSRNSKYSFERPGPSLQGRQEPKESSGGGGRSSRSAQQSKKTHSRGSQSYCQPQKRAKT